MWALIFILIIFIDRNSKLMVITTIFLLLALTLITIIRSLISLINLCFVSLEILIFGTGGGGALGGLAIIFLILFCGIPSIFDIGSENVLMVWIGSKNNGGGSEMALGSIVIGETFLFIY